MKKTKLSRNRFSFPAGGSAASAQSLEIMLGRLARIKLPPRRLPGILITTIACKRYAERGWSDPAPASIAAETTAAKTADVKSADANASAPKAAAETQQAADELKKKIDQQQEKINSLNREIELDQREERLRAAAYYQDAGTRLRNPAEWNKGQTQNINDVSEKQKSLDAARQQLEQMKEDARKAGIAQNDKDASGQNK